MMLKSKYDNALAGVGDGARAGGANGNIIICKHDCKLKWAHMFNKSFQISKMFKISFAAVGRFLCSRGQTHLLACSVATECSF